MTFFRLLDLPIELVYYTISKVDVHDNRVALYNLCLTSRALRNVVQPVLFGDFCFHKVQPKPPVSPSLESPEASKEHLSGTMRRVIQFATAIIRRPDIASKVKHLSLDPWAALPIDITPHLQDSVFSLLLQKVPCFSTPSAEWREKLQEHGLYTFIRCLHSISRLFALSISSFQRSPLHSCQSTILVSKLPPNISKRSCHLSKISALPPPTSTAT